MNKMTIHITFLFVFISTQALAQFKSFFGNDAA